MSQSPSRKRPRDLAKPVVVVGGGVSGLSAAAALAAAGIPVLLLEARARVGGRVHTCQLQNGSTVDCGAAFIHGTDIKHNPVFKLAVDQRVKMDARHGGYSAGWGILRLLRLLLVPPASWGIPIHNHTQHSGLCVADTMPASSNARCNTVR